MAALRPSAILIIAASIRAGQSWDLRLPYASLRVTLRVGPQKQPTFMHLLTGLRLQHPPRGAPLDQIVALALSAQVAAWKGSDDMDTRAGYESYPLLLDISLILFTVHA